jgi:hypothetical protein
VAEHADWPVTEADLAARRSWLMQAGQEAQLKARILANPLDYDEVTAGWWIWGQCTWIGPGWCQPTGEVLGSHRRPELTALYARGRGVHANDRAVKQGERRAWIEGWMQRLADRLRAVRVCCGDWARICTSDSVTTRLGTTGIFLDAPYAHHLRRMRQWVRHLDGDGAEPSADWHPSSAANREVNLYGTDREDADRLVAEVHRYCRDRGADPRYRIVVCGLQGEHDPLEAAGWDVVRWKSTGLSRRGNAARERLWVSPHCLRRQEETRPMFGLWERGEREVTA